MRTGDLLRKSLNLLEELKGQLGERMPIAMRIFAEASKEAGLTVNGTTQELFKQMELGKISAEKILPHVAKGLKKWARNNNALEKSLQRLSVKFGQARTDLQSFQQGLFNKGVESGMKLLLDAFGELMKSSEVIASFLGGAFKGAVLGLVTPFRLVHAAVHDLFVFLGGEWSTSNKDFAKDIVASTGAVMGLVTGVYALIKGLKMLFKVKGATKGLVDSLSGKETTKGAKGGGLFSGMGKRVFVTNMPKGGFGGDMGSTSKKGGNISKLSKFASKVPIISTAVAVSAAGGAAIDQGLRSIIGERYIQADQAFTKAMIGVVNQNNASPRSDSSYLTQPQKVQVEVNLNTDMLEAKVAEGVNSSYQGTYY